MAVGRQNCGLAKWREGVYAIGGVNSICVDKPERYDLAHDAWTLIEKVGPQELGE
jgi:hypothetical protein